MTKIELPPFEPALAKAHTLPARLYTDPAVFAVEQERIFARTWQPVGRTEQLRKPGDFFTCEVAGEPLVVLRDKEGGLRAFFNVCRHRAGPLAVGCGSRKSLTCRYHGWTYGLDGTLLTTPEFEGVACFDKKDQGLVPVQVETFGPLVFVNLDRASLPLASVLGRIPEESAGYVHEQMTMVERREYEVACNWKVYIDNYLEGYHIPMVHPELYRTLDYAAYRVDTFRYYSFQHAPLRPRDRGRGTDQERAYAAAADDARALYYWVFPGWMINVYPDNLQWNGVYPISVDRTRVVFEWYLLSDPTAATIDQAAARASIAQGIAFGDLVQKEDMEICEAVQRGLGSRAYDRGRFSVLRENGVHHFHGLVHEFLSDEGGSHESPPEG